LIKFCFFNAQNQRIPIKPLTCNHKLGDFTNLLNMSASTLFTNSSRARLVLLFVFGCILSAKSTVDAAVSDSTQSNISWTDVRAQPQPNAGIRIAYGDDPRHFGVLRLPGDESRTTLDEEPYYPIIVLIHGGCWLNQFEYDYFDPVADALTSLGFAVWSVAYRRVGDDSGGWPNTYEDVGKAFDFLTNIAHSYPLDLENIIISGHSAGGHLALWLANRSAQNPELLSTKAVVGLAAITDLQTYADVPNTCATAVPRLMGGTFETNPSAYEDATLGADVARFSDIWLLTGSEDRIVPADQAQNFTKIHNSVNHIEIAGAGHFDFTSTKTAAWHKMIEIFTKYLEK
jgi:acetyl esterase/lipase